MALWVNIYELLIALHQPERVAKLASVYLKYLAISVPGLSVFEVCKKQLLVQGITLPVTMVMLAALGVELVLLNLLVWGAGMGLIGSALAFAATNLFMAVGIVIYTACNHRPCWGGWKLEAALSGWTEFLSLGVPLMVQLCSEWWAFEMVSLFCGSVTPDPVAQLAANSILVQMQFLSFVAPLSVSIGTTVRIGQLLGGGRGGDALLASNLGLIVGGFTGLVALVVIVVFGAGIARLVIADDTVVKLVESALWPVAVRQLFDATQVVLMGSMRATDKQHSATIVNLVTQWVIGLPLAYLFCFNWGKGLQGLWIGMGTATILQTICGCFIVSAVDWAESANKAATRASPLLHGGCTATDYGTISTTDLDTSTHQPEGVLIALESSGENSGTN